MPNHEDGSGLMGKIANGAKGVAIAGLVYAVKILFDAISTTKKTNYNQKIDGQISDKESEISDLRSEFLGKYRHSEEINNLHEDITNLRNLRK